MDNFDRKLPVSISDNELPKDQISDYQEISDDRVKTSGGFVNVCFFVAVMIVCFMWGMLVVILR